MIDMGDQNIPTFVPGSKNGSSHDFKPVLAVWPTIFALGVGSLIGGGLFGLTGLAVGYSGPSFLFAILFLALLNVPTVMAYAELGSSIPDTGGGYAWIKMAYGGALGHVAGWGSWGAHSVACSVYALNIGYYVVALLTSYILPHIGIDALWGGNGFWISGIAIILIAWLSVINLRGSASSSRFGMLLVVGLLAVLGLYVALGAINIFLDTEAAKKNFTDIFPNGAWGLITAMGIFSLAFQGSEIVAQAAKEIKEPTRNLKKALFFSYGIIVIVYLFVVFVAFAGVQGTEPSWKILDQAGEGAIARGSSFFHWGIILFPLMLGAGLVASLVALNSTIFSSSHAAKALGDAKSIPYEVGALNKRGSPTFAIVLSAIGMIFMVVVLPLEEVAAVANLLFIFLFLWLNLALIKLRLNRPEIIRPYKVPFFPWLNIFAITGYIFIAIPLFSVSAWGVTIVMVWFFAGMIVWFLFAKKNIEEEIDDETILKAYIPLGGETYSKVFCPVMKGTDWKVLLRIAYATARDRNTGLYICLLQELPKGTTSFKDFDDVAGKPLQEQAILRSKKEQMIQDAQEFYNEVVGELKRFPGQVSFRFISVAASDVPPSIERIGRMGHAQIVLKIVERVDADVLVMPFEQIEFLKRGFIWPTLTRVLRQTRCHLVVVKVGRRDKKFTNDANEVKCLVPYVSNPHGKLLADTIGALHASFGESLKIHFLHIRNPQRKEKTVEKILKEFEVWGIDNPEIEVVANPSTDVSLFIIEKAKEYNLLLLAASRDHSFQEMKFGNAVEKVIENSAITTIVVHRHQEAWYPFVSPFAKLYRRIESGTKKGLSR